MDINCAVFNINISTPYLVKQLSTGIGTGLGLAIVKHVLMQHGAYLEIESKENQGSIFKAIFPKERLYQMTE